MQEVAIPEEGEVAPLLPGETLRERRERLTRMRRRASCSAAHRRPPRLDLSSDLDQPVHARIDSLRQRITVAVSDPEHLWGLVTGAMQGLGAAQHDEACTERARRKEERRLKRLLLEQALEGRFRPMSERPVRHEEEEEEDDDDGNDEQAARKAATSKLHSQFVEIMALLK